MEKPDYFSNRLMAWNKTGIEVHIQQVNAGLRLRSRPAPYLLVGFRTYAGTGYAKRDGRGARQEARAAGPRGGCTTSA